MDVQPRWYQLSLRTLLEIVAVVAVVLAIADQRVGATGRYQIISAPPSGSSTVFMYDSATGKAWRYDALDDAWIPSTPPGLGK